MLTTSIRAERRRQLTTADIYQGGNGNKIGYDAVGSTRDPATLRRSERLRRSYAFGQYGLRQCRGGLSGRVRAAAMTARTGWASSPSRATGNDATLWPSSATATRSRASPRMVGSYGRPQRRQSHRDGRADRQWQRRRAPTSPFYVGTRSSRPRCGEVNPTPPPTHQPYAISGLGVDGVKLNGLANLDQTGSYNLATLGFQGNNNRFNVTQISDDRRSATTPRQQLLAVRAARATPAVTVVANVLGDEIRLPDWL